MTKVAEINCEPTAPFKGTYKRENNNGFTTEYNKYKPNKIFIIGAQQSFRRYSKDNKEESNKLGLDFNNFDITIPYLGTDLERGDILTARLNNNEKLIMLMIASNTVQLGTNEIYSTILYSAEDENDYLDKNTLLSSTEWTLVGNNKQVLNNFYREVKTRKGS